MLEILRHKFLSLPILLSFEKYHEIVKKTLSPNYVSMASGTQVGKEQVDPLDTEKKLYKKGAPMACALHNLLYNILVDTNYGQTIFFQFV